MKRNHLFKAAQNEWRRNYKKLDPTSTRQQVDRFSAGVAKWELETADSIGGSCRVSYRSFSLGRTCSQWK